MKIGYYEIAGGWRQMDDYFDGIRKVTPGRHPPGRQQNISIATAAPSAC